MMASADNWRVVTFGTIRPFNETACVRAADPIRTIAEQYAAPGGATATVTVNLGYSTTANDARWFNRASSVLRNTLGDTRLLDSASSMPAEDCSVLLQRVPGLFFVLGVTTRGRDPFNTPANPSPMHDIDEAAMPLSVKSLSALAIDALLHAVPSLPPVK